MENSELKNFIIAMSVFSASFLLIFILYFLKTNGIYIHIGTPPPSGISLTFIYGVLIITVAISGMCLTKSTIIRIFIGGICSLIILWNLIFSSLDFNESYTTFSSPDKNEHFIVVEKGYGVIYQLSNSHLFMTELGKVRTDDGYQPFSEGAFKLKWEKQNQLLVQYAFTYSVQDRYKELLLEYKNSDN